MNEMIEEMIENAISHGAVKDLLTMPDDIFDRVLERLQQRRARCLIRFVGDDPAGQDTPEG